MLLLSDHCHRSRDKEGCLWEHYRATQSEGESENSVSNVCDGDIEMEGVPNIWRTQIRLCVDRTGTMLVLILLQSFWV